MSKKFNKIMSVVLALMMVCSLLPMSAMAAENDTYTVTFAPGTLCIYTGEGEYPTMTYDGTGEFKLPEPTELNLVGDTETPVFQGWTLQGGDGTFYNAGDNVADLITGNVTFLANYMESVISETVTYTISPGTIEDAYYNRPVERGPIPTQYVSETTLPTTNEGISREFGWTIPADYTFVRWEKADGTVIPAATVDEEETGRTVPFIPKDGDVYTAIWTEATVTTYTVTLHPGTADGTPVPGEPVQDGSFAAGTEYYGPAENPFTMVGYHSTGWSYTEGGAVIQLPITVNSNIDLYAVWEKDEVREYWCVTLHAGEGATFQEFVAGFENKDGLLIGQAEKELPYNIALPSAFDTVIVEREDENGNIVQVEVNATFATQPEGMEFAGWKNDSTGEVHYSGEVITVSADSAFTAQWRPAGEGPYNVIVNAGTMANFDFRGETYVNHPFSEEAAVGSTYDLPTTKEEVLEKFGWNVPDEVSFVGWVLADQGDEPITSVENITHDTVVVALWETPEPFVFTVTFDAGGGEGYMDPDIHTSFDDTYEYVVPKCTFTAPEGMVFDGWEDQYGESYIPGDIIEMNAGETITLTAIWIEGEEANFIGG